MHACAQAPRPGQDGTWIAAEMLSAYGELHRLGHAHSVEVWSGERLVGGIYGVAVGRMFFGESMFSAESGGSKAALAGLLRAARRTGAGRCSTHRSRTRTCCRWVPNACRARISCTGWSDLAAQPEAARGPGRKPSAQRPAATLAD